VADRLVASPGSGDYGVLAAQVGLVADVDRVLTLPPGAFRPPPKVTSAVVRLRFRAPGVDTGNPAAFERIVRGVFLQRRKTLANALKPVADTLGQNALEMLERAGLDPSRRPETLTVEEFARLSRAVL
jgi:16S rRNA (adenine1518-N6/adenine1519-N6)-dimethyltransferase